MTTWAVLATGPSLGRMDVSILRGRCKVVAVSDAYRLAPWCDAIASTDRAWWKAHPEALAMDCRKFGVIPSFNPLHEVETLNVDAGTNSGLLGIMAAVKLGATTVLMLGFDLHSPGEHFFGRHGGSLKSTSPQRMEVFKRQFAAYRPRGVGIVNCTPGTALDCFPKGEIEDSLAELAV